MKREIKFRAWDINKKAWKGLWIFRGGHTEQYDVSNNKIDILDLTNKWQGCVLMQFTGLHDKNGKEIYEGDIVDFGNKIQYEVEWSPENAMFHLKGPNDIYSLIFNECEVIGNIYENPELIKS